MDNTLLNIYQEANEHLRICDNKRDQIIAFYLVILGLLFSSFDKITKLPYEMQILLYSIIGLFGCTLAIIVHKLRFWHIVYVNTAVVIQNLALSKIQPSERNVKEIWDSYQESIKETRHQLNVENLTRFAFYLVAFIPFDFLLYTLKINLWYIVVFHFIWMVFIHLYSDRDLKKMLSKGHQTSWMLKIDLMQKTEDEQTPG